jgi:hypothetical protein
MPILVNSGFGFVDVVGAQLDEGESSTRVCRHCPGTGDVVGLDYIRSVKRACVGVVADRGTSGVKARLVNETGIGGFGLFQNDLGSGSVIGVYGEISACVRRSFWPLTATIVTSNERIVDVENMAAVQ